MRRHARWPAILVLLLATLSGAAVLAALRPAAHSVKTLAELELAVAAPGADAATWQAYADKLRQAGRFGHAVAAYRRALESQPDLREARFNLGLTLGQASSADAFFEYMKPLVISDAALAVDILERRECQSKTSDPRFAPLVQEAKTQAMD